MNFNKASLLRVFFMAKIAMLIFLVVPASANFSINIGMSRGDVARILVSKGYSQIKVHDTGFKTGKAYACKDGVKYNIKVDYKGRIKAVSEIGSCRNTVTEAQVRKNLEANGFERVVIDEQNNNYVVIGCRQNQRMRLIVSLQGEFLQRKQIGKCLDVLEPNDVRQVLRDKGYNRVRFTDRQLPRYVAEACLNNRKMELVLNRFGQVRSERRLGRCERPLEPGNLIKHVQDKGYNTVTVIKAKPPRYEVEACSKNVLYTVSLDRFGKITKRERLGDCNPLIDKEQITNLLKQEGFTRINIKQGFDGVFTVNSCFQGYIKGIRLSRYGELLEETDGKQCKSRTISQIDDVMKNRGFKNSVFYVETCSKGRKLKITLDNLGDVVARERLGNC